MRLRDESGQILVIAALAQIVFLVIVGFAVDYGFWLLERQRLQNAVDAASLAGARALVDGASPGIDAARATTLDYLSRHGYVTDAATAVDVDFPVGAGGAIESVAVDVERTRDTYFVRLVGVEDVELGARATAAVDRRMIDIMLSLDLTGSMELSGTNDLQQLRDAVVDFVNMVNPSPSNPLGPKIGMARFAGVVCRWQRSSGSDTIITLFNGEYRAPCADDKTLLTNLTLNKNTLLKLANNSGSAACPSGMSQYACPLDHFVISRVQRADNGQWVTPLGLDGNISAQPDIPDPAPRWSGTKLPNGITVVDDPATGYYAWSTANGGRNNAAGEGTARKVLVMITDGQNELWPVQGHPESTAAWDTEVRTRANALKLGPDGIANTSDDVEIYTIGFFCHPYNASSTSAPTKWCKSELVQQAQPRACPGPVMPASSATSAIDVLLRDVSSSAPGACDRYFPIRKTEDLPELFRTIAGAITRGRLTQ